MHSNSDKIEIMINDVTDEILEKLYNSLRLHLPDSKIISTQSEVVSLSWIMFS